MDPLGLDGKYSLLFVHGKRDRLTMDAGGVLPSFAGLAVHDAWPPYGALRDCAALMGRDTARTGTTTLMAKHHTLARRMIDRQDDYLRFTLDPQAPFDNNAA